MQRTGLKGPDSIRLAPRQRSIRELISDIFKRRTIDAWCLGLIDPNGNVVHFTLSDESLEPTVALQGLFAPPASAQPLCDLAALEVVSADSDRAIAAIVAPVDDYTAKLVVFSKTPVSFDAGQWANSKLSFVALLRILRRESDAFLEDTNVQRTSQSAMYVLNRELVVEYSSLPPEGHGAEKTSSLQRRQDGLPAFLVHPVRTLVADWDFDDVERCPPRTTRPIPGLLVRVQPLLHNGGVCVGLLTEPYRTRRSMHSAFTRYGISAREREILDLLLEGYTIPDISSALQIAESTAQEHVKKLISKTQSRTRIEMAAKILGWPLRRRALTTDAKRENRRAARA